MQWFSSALAAALMPSICPCLGQALHVFLAAARYSTFPILSHPQWRHKPEVTIHSHSLFQEGVRHQGEMSAWFQLVPVCQDP